MDADSSRFCPAVRWAGAVWVNTHHVGDPAPPFGGYKPSGWGREMSNLVLERYTETKAVAAAP
jgi:phenylacetaldehyde dehydrogenase